MIRDGLRHRPAYLPAPGVKFHPPASGGGYHAQKRRYLAISVCKRDCHVKCFICAVATSLPPIWGSLDIWRLATWDRPSAHREGRNPIGIAARDGDDDSGTSCTRHRPASK